MSATASQITGVKTVYLIVCLGADQTKHQGFASLAFVWGIHRWSVNSPHKVPVTRKIVPCGDVIMCFVNVCEIWIKTRANVEYTNDEHAKFGNDRYTKKYVAEVGVICYSMWTYLFRYGLGWQTVHANRVHLYSEPQTLLFWFWN